MERSLRPGGSKRKVCFNSKCLATSSKNWRRGWMLLRSHQQYADLCDSCGLLYEQLRFCEVFHYHDAGWRTCYSCEKRVHCGCIASTQCFVLLDTGGVECLDCDKQRGALGMNRLDDRCVVQRIEGSPGTGNDHIVATRRPLPEPTACEMVSNMKLASTLDQKSEVEGCQPVECKVVDEGIHSVCDRRKEWKFLRKHNSGSSRIGRVATDLTEYVVEENKPEMDSQKLVKAGDGDVNMVRPAFIEATNGIEVKVTAFGSGEASSELFEFKTCHVQDTKGKEQDLLSSGSSLSGSSKSSKGLGRSSCDIHLDPNHSWGEKGSPFSEYGEIGTDSPREVESPCFSLQFAKQDCFQAMSKDSICGIEPLFEKVLSISDAGRIGRLVIPKACAEHHFPRLRSPEGFPMDFQDISGKHWTFQYRYWPNNNSRMYVLEGVVPFIQSLNLKAGDTVCFNRLETETRILLTYRRTSLSPKEAIEGLSVGTLDVAPLRIVGASNSEEETDEVSDDNNVGQVDALDVPLSRETLWKGSLLDTVLSAKVRGGFKDSMNVFAAWDEAQGLMRPPPGVFPSILLVDGNEIEEYDEPPVFAMSLVSGTMQSGMECTNIKQDIRGSIKDTDAMANEIGPKPICPVRHTRKHPRHKVGCMCIICTQLHKSSCMCIFSVTLRRDQERNQEQELDHREFEDGMQDSLGTDKEGRIWKRFKVEEEGLERQRKSWNLPSS